MHSEGYLLLPNEARVSHFGLTRDQTPDTHRLRRGALYLVLDDTGEGVKREKVELSNNPGRIKTGRQHSIHSLPVSVTEKTPKAKRGLPLFDLDSLEFGLWSGHSV